MKIKQNVRHFASRKALETPIVRSVAHRALVNLHSKIFLRKADPDHREERRDHLDAFFNATIDTYLAALQEGHSEAEAREITHIQANIDFFNHGWLEMMEIPADEVEEHYRRYETFFGENGVTVGDPLGEFRPPDGVAEAAATPEKFEAGQQPQAGAGFADDVYVDTGEEILVGGRDEPAEVDVTDAPGVRSDDVEE